MDAPEPGEHEDWRADEDVEDGEKVRITRWWRDEQLEGMQGQAREVYCLLRGSVIVPASKRRRTHRREIVEE